MKRLHFFVFLAGAVALASCASDPSEPQETISGPHAPIGPNVADVDESVTYGLGGATSSQGHDIQYRLDLDADGIHRYTRWTGSDDIEVSWPDSALYLVKAQARCAQHVDIASSWSDGRVVAVAVAFPPPVVYFATHIGHIWRPYDPVAPLDTVGMFRPFNIGYHGVSPNGLVEAYKFFSLSAGVTLPGADVWVTDLSDTLRVFPNSGDDALPSGVFRLAAQCRDMFEVESIVDAAEYEEGVAQVVVNYDPDTWILGGLSTYSVDDVLYQEAVDFGDAIPDTMPMRSWLRIDYAGREDPRDGSACPRGDPDLCLGFQIAYNIEIPSGMYEDNSYWQPRDGRHDTNPYSAADSNTINIGSLDYELRVRAVDEFGRPDATWPSVEIVGNHAPTLDEVIVEDHLGNRIDLSIVDTITWNFWKGEGWPYECECDTVDKTDLFCAPASDPPSCQSRTFPENGGTMDYYKKFSFSIRASGHDHPKDPTDSGIEAWEYRVMNSSGQFINLAKSLGGWFDGAEIDVLDEVIRWKVYYPGPSSGNPDPYGDTVFDNLPIWVNDDLTFFLVGRDAGEYFEDFEQYMYINAEPQLINSYRFRGVGRQTEETMFAFRVTLVRP